MGSTQYVLSCTNLRGLSIVILYDYRAVAVATAWIRRILAVYLHVDSSEDLQMKAKRALSLGRSDGMSGLLMGKRPGKPWSLASILGFLDLEFRLNGSNEVSR